MVRTDALKRAQVKYYQKIKDTTDHKNKVKKYQEAIKVKYNTNEEYRKKKQKQSLEYYYNKKNSIK